MKFSIAAALVALSATVVSAGDYKYSGTIYVYSNDLFHPKTTFVKRGDNLEVVTNGAACKGNQTLPGRDYSLAGTFTTVKNQWDFNGQHQNEIWMGYIRVGDHCLTLTKGNPLSLDKCPSFDEEIKAGNKFAWFHDKRNSAVWAYGGDADAIENNGLSFNGANFQSSGNTLIGAPLSDDDNTVNTFMGLGHVNLGHTGKKPKGCE